MSSHAKNDDNAIQTAEMVNNDLLDLLRKYYILCKQTADKQDIVKVCCVQIYLNYFLVI